MQGTKVQKSVAIMCVILTSMLDVGIGAVSEEEWGKTKHNCSNNDKSACQALIDSGLPSVKQCNKDDCSFVGVVYYQMERYTEAILYFEKAIALGDSRGYFLLGLVYYDLQDYAKKYYKIGCGKINNFQSASCVGLATVYQKEKVYRKAKKLYKKSCDMKNGVAFANLAFYYKDGVGVKQNQSIAKQYYGKACDLGEQLACDSYKLLQNR